MGEYAISDFLFLCSYCLILFKNCATLTLEGTLPFCIPVRGMTIAGVPSFMMLSSKQQTIKINQPLPATDDRRVADTSNGHPPLLALVLILL